MRNPVVGVLLLASSASFSSDPAVAQDTELARTFSTIIVTGNSRFRDGDILATADLRPGEAYTEADIVAAVEALEFTGEFEKVRIFSSGEVLTIAVDEEPEYTGNLSFGLGADSDIGVFGTARLSLENVLGGKDLTAQTTVAKEVVTFSSQISADDFWPGTRSGGIRLNFADYDYEDTLFDFRTSSIQPFVNFGSEGGVTGEFRFTALWTDISAVDADASAIIQSEAGDRFVAGPGLGLSWGGGPESSWRLGLTLDVFGGDSEFADAAVTYSNDIPFFGPTSLRTRGRVGTVRSFGDSTTTAVDRKTLGGSAMRGFARGGISPVDFCAGCGGGGEDIVTRLGGERYAVLQNDLRIHAFDDSLPFTPSLYFDVGTVWGLESDTAPSGIVDDDIAWRSSAGIAVTADTGIGSFSASIALTTNSEVNDDTEEFSLSFTTEF